jgi:tetratricopeptide (TPR) repeat protein
MTPLPPAAAASASTDSRAHRLIALLGCVALSLLVYLPTALRARFLNFDDNLYFGPDNPLFRAALAAARERGVFAGLALVLDPRQVVADVYLPVAHGSLWLDAWWFGDADGNVPPVGPHVVNALLHGLAAFVLVRLFLRLRLPPAVAYAAGAVFVLHPALCESVAWVSGRKDVLSGLFVFLALHQTARLCERFSALRVCGIAACGVLAMYSKATAVVLPLLAVLVCLMLPGPRRRWWAPLALLLVVLPIAWHHRVIAAAAGTMVPGSVFDRLAHAPGAFLHYLRAALWPTGLNVLYPEVQTLERFRAQWAAGAAALLLLALLAVAAWRRPAWRPLGFAIAAFACALLPFNTVWPASVIAAADRYLYLATPFAALLVLWPLSRALRRPALVGGALAGACMVLCFLRAPAFASDNEVWAASLAADPDNAVAWLKRSEARLGRGGLDVSAFPQVAEWYERAAAAARYPEHEWRARLGQLQLALFDNRYADAARFAEQAVAAAERIGATGRQPEVAARATLVQTLLYSLGPLRASGRLADAKSALQRAESLMPDSVEVAVAGALIATDELADEFAAELAAARAAVGASAGAAAPPADDAAVAAIRARLQRAGASVDAAEAAADGDVDARQRALHSRQLLQLATGKLERLLGNRLQAIRAFQLAIDAVELQHTCDVEAAECWLGAAGVCLDAAIYPEAEKYARQGIAWAVASCGVQPDARLLHARSRALAGQGRLDDAIAQLEPHVRSHPKDRDAARLLSSLLMAKAIARLSQPKVTQQELQDLIDRALAVNPEEPRVDIVRARLLRDRRQFGPAVEALDRARKALPDFEDLGVMLAENLRDLGYQLVFQKDDDGAAAAWTRFLQFATKEMPVEAVQAQLHAIWTRAEERGIEAQKRGDLDEAERQFRRCLQIDPAQHWAAWHLAVVLWTKGGRGDTAELDRLSQQALQWCEGHQIERSRQVLLRALVLQRLQQDERARALVDGYLAEPDSDAPAQVLAQLRAFGKRGG